MKLKADTCIGYVYGSSGLYTGTDPGTSVPSTSAPYGNYSSSYYDPSGTAPYSTGSLTTVVDPTGTIGTAVSTGDPSVGTVASTGDPSGSGKLTYTAPTGVPSEYFYHHKKPKRNVSPCSILS